MNPLNNWLPILQTWRGRQFAPSEWEAAVLCVSANESIDPKLLAEQLLQHNYISRQDGVIQIVRRTWYGKKRIDYRCNRCGNEYQQYFQTTPCASCNSPHCIYCEHCLQMGRTKQCTPLLMISQKNVPPMPNEHNLLPFPNVLLTPNQQAGANFIFDHIQTGGECLLWAVTGAGKTEMLFPLIHRMLCEAKSLLIATPRKDVVIELGPRLRKAFGSDKIVELYGGCQDPWAGAPITLATTHQLIRFREAFDVVIVDECDAFPYKDNETLQRLVRRSLVEKGLIVWLTATPPKELIKKQKAIFQVTSRFHGFLMPIPKRLANSNKSVSQHVLDILSKSIARGACVFFFVPEVKMVTHVMQILRDALGQIDKIDGTFAADPKRSEKIQRFRDRSIRILVTTSILERGITLPMADVVIWHADHRLFDEASLVQMAGRAGRSVEDAQQASVWFVSETFTDAQRGAIRQLKAMNSVTSA